MTTYAILKAARDAADAELSAASKVLNSFPKGPTGLTPDEIKFSPEYRDVYNRAARAFATVRKLNAYIMRNHAKEEKADRDARRQARQQNSAPA
jgi:hypothetical protein